jgi:hypothetical protein
MAKAFRDEQQKRQMRKDDESDDGKEEEQSKDVRLAFQDANKTVATIFGGCAASESKRQQKLTARQVMSITMYDTVADPKYLDWSEHPITFSITFSRADQWADIPYPGCFPLVLDLTIRNVRFKKVLIDGGSALNILFAGALTELGLTKDDLVNVDSPFWGYCT